MRQEYACLWSGIKPTIFKSLLGEVKIDENGVDTGPAIVYLNGRIALMAVPSKKMMKSLLCHQLSAAKKIYLDHQIN